MNKKGFTLIELLAIIVLLGLIAATAVPKITKQAEENDEQIKAVNKQTIENASKLYVAKYYANKLVNKETITFTLSDLEKDGLLAKIPDGCTGYYVDKREIRVINGKSYDYRALNGCYSR